MSTRFNKGQVTLLHLVVGGAFTLLASVGSSWVSGAQSANKETYENKLHQQEIDGAQNEIIGQTRTSVCVLNQNIINIGNALHVPVVPDPNCR